VPPLSTLGCQADPVILTIHKVIRIWMDKEEVIPYAVRYHCTATVKTKTAEIRLLEPARYLVE